MSAYNNFFIGIPIPEKYIHEYEKILLPYKNARKSLKLNLTKNLHITALFMGKQSERSVGKVERVVEDNKRLLSEVVVKIKGYGRFKNKNYDTIYINVTQNRELSKFYRKIKKELKETFESKKNNFNPHLTIARIKNKELQIEKQGELETALKSVDWQFPVTEIKLYGRESENRNRQVVIKTIRI